MKPLREYFSSVEAVNLTSGRVTLLPELPVVGRRGCAVLHEGYVYWVRAYDGGQDSADVYRASGELLGPSL